MGSEHLYLRAGDELARQDAGRAEQGDAVGRDDAGQALDVGRAVERRELGAQGGRAGLAHERGEAAGQGGDERDRALGARAVGRLLAAEYADRGELLKSLNALREDLDALEAELEAGRQREEGLPHRERALRLNRRLAERIVAAHRQWLDEVEAEL